MTKMIFVNLPVRDLAASTAFYTALGGELNPMYSGEHSAVLAYSEAISVALLTHEHYRTFTSLPIGDAHRDSQAMHALTVDTRETVDATIVRATAAGGTADPRPAQDQGFMYTRTVADPDGNVWELMWMDPAASGS